VKGKFEKRAYTKKDVESLIMSRWTETFVNMKDIDEARKDFLSCRGLEDHYSYDNDKWNEVKEKITKWFGDENK